MDVQEFRRQIFDAARPVLKGRKLTDLVIGISMLAVELDAEDIAVSYVLRDNLPGGCSVFNYASKAVGMDAEEAAEWFVTGGDDVQRAIGGAIMTAASYVLELEDSNSPGRPFGVEINADDKVGMVGNIRPVVKQLRRLGCKMIIFDKGSCSEGNLDENVYPMERQRELLPGCDLVFLSGTTTVNGTAPELIELCGGARDIVLLGSSVPMIPAGFKNTGVSIIAGSWWRHEDKEKIFRLISQGAGMKDLSRFAIKKNVRVE
ncbi:MAG: Rossmann-like domain-containing protein [Candidatus Limivicinus sp.]|jgi:uncharacterized protein (DUF4213/DUF364 family)